MILILICQFILKKERGLSLAFLLKYDPKGLLNQAVLTLTLHKKINGHINRHC
jgi:hypothetical protein